MGRYYHGDIEGKFWFAIQDSDDASNFGGEETPIYDTFETDDGREQIGIEYNFTQEHLPDIDEGIKLCLEGLGEYKDKMDSFFSQNLLYERKTLTESLGLSSDNKSEALLVLYARLELGNKIRECVIQKGKCSFNADFY